PAGKLVATTGGSWGYIYDWGPQSKNPIPNVTEVVGTWEVPGKTGGQYVLVDLESPWAVSSKSPNVGLAKKVMLELDSVKADVAYAQNLGNIPGRTDAAADPEFQKLTPLVPILAALKNGTGTYLKTPRASQRLPKAWRARPRHCSASRRMRRALRRSWLTTSKRFWATKP